MWHLRDGEIKCKNQIKNSIAFVKANGWAYTDYESVCLKTFVTWIIGRNYKEYEEDIDRTTK